MEGHVRPRRLQAVRRVLTRRVSHLVPSLARSAVILLPAVRVLRRARVKVKVPAINSRMPSTRSKPPIN